MLKILICSVKNLFLYFTNYFLYLYFLKSAPMVWRLLSHAVYLKSALKSLAQSPFHPAIVMVLTMAPTKLKTVIGIWKNIPTSQVRGLMKKTA